MKFMRGVVLSFVPLLSIACATAPVPAPKPVPVTAAPIKSDFTNARLDFEQVYADILAHEQKPVNAPVVDVEAAKSIDIPEHRSIPAAVSLFSKELHGHIPNDPPPPPPPPRPPREN